MSEISELLEIHCPKGVPNLPLGDLVNILDSQRKPVAKDMRVIGEYPYYGANGIQGYVEDFIFDGTYLLVGEDGSVMNSDHSPVLNLASGKFWVNNHAHVLGEKEDLASLKYLYYFLQTLDISKIVRGVPPKLNQELLKNILIKIPPIIVQNKIVEVLDQLSNLEDLLVSELNNELTARDKQIKYYKEMLFNFEAENVKIKDICSSFSGKFIKKTKQDDSLPYPVYNGGASPSGFFDKYNAEANSIAISARGSMGFVNFVSQKFWAGNSCHVLSLTSDKVKNEYLYYFLKVHESELSNLGRYGSIPALNLEPLMNFEVKVPSINQQIQIVETMGKLEELKASLDLAIKSEIVNRKRQYAYYRDILLEFKELESA
jgi:type I restriction enzyme S subunit